MANRQTPIIVASAVVVAAGFAVLLSRPRLVKAPPITFHFVINDASHVPPSTYGTGRTFWVTNNSSRGVLVSITAIEIRVGSNWTARRLPSRLLEFQPSHPGKSARPGLGAHQAGYAALATSVPPISQPSGTIWRARVDVGQEMTGLPRVWAAVRGYIQRRRFGLSGMPANPFSSAITYWGKPTEVVSEEIIEE